MKARAYSQNLSFGLWLFLVAGLIAPIACAFSPDKSGSGSGGTTGAGNSSGKTIPGLTSLMITPTSATITASNSGTQPTQQYKVMGLVNGRQQDVTSQVGYSMSIGGVVTMSGGGLATAVGNTGGVVVISAVANNISANATLTVKFSFTGADPGMPNVPSDAATHFTTTNNDSSRAPQLIYPNDGVLFPPNVTGVEIHFMPGANNTLFEVSFQGAATTVNTFIRCTAPSGINGCIYLPDPTLWGAVASGNAGAGSVTVTVRGTDDSGSSVGNSATFHMSFARDPIRGALYYWTTSGKTAIMRWDFGGSTTSATSYLTPTNTDGSTCVGCHALSPNGDKLVASAGGQNDGRLLLWNIMSNTAQQSFPLSQKSQFESWNADGTQFVGIYGDSLPNHTGSDKLMIFDGTSGAVTSMIDLGGLRADHPDWSKAGSDTIAFTSIDPTAPTTDQRPATGGIDMVQETGGTWGAPQTLVPSMLGKNRYYPAIAPDGNTLIYDESTCSGTAQMGKAPDVSCDADTDATATIFMTDLSARTPIQLTNANAPGVADGSTTALTNSFPKWAPFIENLDELNKVLWITFSSTRQYGLRTPPNPADTDETTKGTLIWMVGINLGVGNGDPSFTAFCLPFQDITTSNHIAQWTKYFIQGPG